MEKPRSVIEQHWPEGLLSVILLGATTVAWMSHRITADAAVVIDVITATLAIYVVILKGYFAREAESLAARQTFLDSRTGEISSILAELGSVDFDYAIPIVDSALERLRLIRHGDLQLDPTSYYNDISDALKSAKPHSRIFAVSSMPTIDRWTTAPRQINYFKENVETRSRGVQIHRVFIIQPEETNPAYLDKVRAAILEQKAAKITVYCVWFPDVQHDPSLYEDFVCFDEVGIAYTVEMDKRDPTKVLFGHRFSNKQKLQKFRSVFQSLTERYCIDPTTLNEFLTSVRGASPSNG